MQTKIATTITALWCAAAAVAQTFTLQGKVTDQAGQPMEFVSVAVPSQGKVALTSLKGEYSMELRTADSVAVRFSMIGYKAKTRVLRNPKGKQTLQVSLHENENTLEEVTIRELRRQTGQSQELNKEDLDGMPTASGNAVEALVQAQAGVSSHNELSSQYNVRGGSFDENSVYINNVEVYRPFLVRSGQQEGLSVINSDMVERISFSTGGFEAKYGDKMSSALDITYRRPDKFEAKAQASLLGGSLYIGTGGKKVAWTAGLRYKTTKYLLGTLQTTGEYRPAFIDFQTYLSYSPNERWRIDAIGNIADNRFEFVPKDRETSFGTMENVKSFKVYFDGAERDVFRTFFGSVGVTRHFGGTSLELLGAAFNTRERENYDIQGQYWLTQTETSEDLGVGTYFEHARNRLDATVKSLRLTLRSKAGNHGIEAAAGVKWEDIRERSAEYEMRDSAGYSIPHTGRDLHMIYSLKAQNTLSATRVEAYIQDTYKIQTAGGTLYTLNYGLRGARWSFNGETIISPRASVGIIPSGNDRFTIRAAAGIYYQSPFYKELRDTATAGGTTTARLNSKIKSQRSIHFIAGADYRFNMLGRPFKFTAEAYYKLLSNLVPYSVNNVKVTYYGTNDAAGHAAGLDFKLYGEFVPGTDSWVSLSLMDASMTLNGRKLPLPTNQRYSVNAYFTDYFPGTTKWKMSLRMAFADGLPFSTPHKELETNTFRASAYRRVDIGMAYRLADGATRGRKTGVKNVWAGIDCLNLFGINNVNSYYWITDVTNHQYAVPNYLTGRQVNARITVEF